MITTTSAFMVNSMPIAGLKERNVLASVPAAAARAPPLANASAEREGTSMPTSRAPTGSIARALSAAPNRVRSIAYQVARQTTRAATTTNRR